MSATENFVSKPSDNEDWVVEQSDDELYGEVDSTVGIWLPPLADIVHLFTALDEKKPVQLEWQCPGRRSKSPLADNADLTTTETHGQQNNTSDNPATEFDFDDIFSEHTEPKITPRRTPGFTKQLKGSGQKRTASFKNVMFDIRRQMRLEKLDKSSASAAGTSKDRKSPLELPENADT